MMYTRITTIVIFLVYTGISVSQDTKYPFYLWDKKDSMLCRTFNDEINLTLNEKEILFLTNLARTKPSLFADTYLKQYLDENHSTQNSYTKGLYNQLKKMKSCSVLTPEKSLYNMAYTHALTSGKNGEVGHDHYEQRLKKHTSNKFMATAENCSYGFNDPKMIFFQLLIDDQVPSLGHRISILNNAYQFIGISIQVHKKYEFNCVMEFGSTHGTTRKKNWFTF